jgi:hypothetical protein
MHVAHDPLITLPIAGQWRRSRRGSWRRPDEIDSPDLFMQKTIKKRSLPGGWTSIGSSISSTCVPCFLCDYRQPTIPRPNLQSPQMRTSLMFVVMSRACTPLLRTPAPSFPTQTPLLQAPTILSPTFTVTCCKVRKELMVNDGR